jgi:hypothetical protein
MEIFISWSGERSKAVATLLKRWIPDVIQQISPWVSHIDINAGTRWNNEIQARLSKVKFGIICLTSENTTASWILFEAGALAKTLDDTFVCPYLVDLKPSDIPGGPLTQFQAKTATREGTWELLLSINAALKESGLSDNKLQRAFARCWPELESELSNLPPSGDDHYGSRSSDDKIEEILMIVRELKRFPIKSLYLLDPDSQLDLNAVASLHDMSKFSTDFQQRFGRIQRKAKDSDNESDDA